MKVLFFLGGSYVSGLEVANLHLINELSVRNVEVHCIINGWNDGDIKNRLDQSGISYTEVKLGWVYLRKMAWTMDTLLHLRNARKRVRKLIHDWNPDVIHFCNYANVVMLFDIINRPSIFNLQEPHEPTFKHKLIYRLLPKRINTFTTVSNSIKKKMVALDIPEQKIEVIYNGIPAQATRSKQIQDVVVIGIIGQVVPWKGHETLVKAAAELVSKGVTNFNISIFGNDQTDYATELKQLIETLHLATYFSWEGFEKQQEKIYDAVQCVVIPSVSEEPCSLTIIEAMWNAKAVVASDRGGNIELIDHQENGLLFEAENHMDLSEKIQLLLGSTQTIARLGKEAYNKASSRLTATQMGAAYFTLYQNILTKPS